MVAKATFVTFYSDANFYPDQSIGYLVRVCHQLGSANLDQLFADEGLTHIQWSALISIYFGRGETCAALARDLAHDKGAMTRMIDAMEAKGWVERQRDRADRRLNNLTLTPEGVAVAHRCRAKLIACWNTWLHDWDEREIATFIAQLARLRHALEADPTCAA